jgi:hypothetical protein
MDHRIFLREFRQALTTVQRFVLKVKVHRAKVEQEYARLIVVHPEALRHMLKGVREKLEPVPPAGVWDASVDAAVDDVFRRLPEKLLAHE